jgi:hypothetical protein
MLIRSTRVAVLFTILAALHTAASAQEPAEDTLKRIVEEGNPAYLDWSTALADRELIGRLYAANGYRLSWSDGEKPSGDALFFDDIYGHDQRLEAALNSRRPRTAAAKPAAEP